MGDYFVCVKDYEQHASRTLPKNILQFYNGGAGDELTLQQNCSTFQRLRIRPRVLQDVSRRTCSSTVLNRGVSMPVGISPMSMQCLVSAEGECSTAKAAGLMGTVFILSTLSTTSIEDVAAAAPHTIKWFQLYVYKEREVTQKLVKRAEAAGFKALVLTVDSAIYGMRRADMRNKFKLPPHLKLANFTEGMNKTDSAEGLKEYCNSLYDQSLTWKDITWLKGITELPIVVKGILTAEDAVLAVDHGAAAVMVSNHGGRQLDGVPATIEALPEIVRAVGARVEVYLDGGVRQGTDVFKALALGAKMVFIGRPALWGLSHSGQDGVYNILKILQSELETVMGLSGCCKVEDIKPEMVVDASFYSHL